ncbi:MAG: FCD domain-containing protein [Burkholderiaceae bacterium]|nr:FCD domain-containing protein [Burkholderiaceae bacterium]
MKHRLNDRLPDQLARRLERAIVTRELRPGERLPAERAWAAQLGVSRAALREALRLLAERGLVQQRHGAGSFVAERPDERRADPWTQLLQRQPLMQADLLEFREMLEIRCAELAAERADAADLARLAERHAAVAAAYAGADRAEQVRADVAFHRAIADATRNPVFSYLVATLLELLHEHVQLSIADLAPDSAEARDLAAQHAALWQALRAHDPAGAAAAARRHIGFVRQRWARRMAGIDDSA